MPRLTIRIEACTEILAVLVIMAWADGKLEDREKASIRAAATVLNLNKDLRERLDSMLETPVPLDQVLVQNLNPKDRSFAYVAAAWLSGVDEEIDPKEADMLKEVRDLLGIDAERALELETIARDLKPHDGAWAADLVALFKSIPVRLEASTEEELEVAFE
jgi:uncharacterized membrane protein YebE (DUF533 family)